MKNLIIASALIVSSTVMAESWQKEVSNKEAVLTAVSLATHKTTLKCTITNPMNDSSVRSPLYRTTYPATSEVYTQGPEIKIVSRVTNNGKTSETVALITTSADDKAIVKFEERITLMTLDQTNSGTIREPKISSKQVLTPVSVSICE